MKVLFLTDSLSDWDGVGRYSIRLIDALQTQYKQATGEDMQAEVLLARKHRPTSDFAKGRWPTKVALPPDYFYYMTPSRFAPSLAWATWNIARAARSADLVHAIKDYPHNLAGLLGARMAGKPCVATAHGTYTVQPLLSDRHRKRTRWTYGRLAKVISVSGYTKRRVFEVLDELGERDRDKLELQPNNVHVIPNAVDASHYDEQRNLEGRAWSDKRFVLSIAEVKERKGLHLAVEAFVKLAPEQPDLHHFIVGKATGDEYQQSLLAMAENAGVSERLHFLGNIDEDEKIDLLQRCEVFVHTPVRAADGGFEGFGIVYLEASACSKPCIGTLHCGAEDAIVEGESGRLVEPDVPSVSQALRQLCTNTEERKRLGVGGRAVAERSSWTVNAQRVLELYGEVLGRDFSHSADGGQENNAGVS